MAPGGYTPSDEERAQRVVYTTITSDANYPTRDEEKLRRENEQLKREVARLNRELMVLRPRRR